MRKLQISKNIAILRQNKGITQEALAQKLGVTNQAISKWEAGKCCPDIELLPLLAKIFECSIDELMMGDSTQSIAPILHTEDTQLTQAIKIAQKNQRISTAILQRELSIGYSKAKSLIEQMLENGFIVKDEKKTYNTYLYQKSII